MLFDDSFGVDTELEQTDFSGDVLGKELNLTLYPEELQNGHSKIFVVFFFSDDFNDVNSKWHDVQIFPLQHTTILSAS